MRTKQKIVHRRGPSNLNLGIFVYSFDFCRVSYPFPSINYGCANLGPGFRISGLNCLYYFVGHTIRSQDFNQLASVNCIESLAKVNECKDAGQVVSFGSLYQPPKRDDLSNGRPLLKYITKHFMYGPSGNSKLVLFSNGIKICITTATNR